MSKKKLSERMALIAYILVVSLCCFLCFSHLTTLEIRVWDEARNAVNAIEMVQNGFSVVTTFSGEPEHWNTKPPLLIWIQAALIKLLGISELAIRLPSVIAALGFIPFIFFLKKTCNFTHGFVLSSLVVLFTIPFFLNIHTFRTGDYDGLLSFLMFAYSILFYFYLLKEKSSYLAASMGFLFLAIMTKGIAACLFLPGLFVMTIVHGKLANIFRDRTLYIGVLLVFGGVASYYGIRNYLDPQYWQFVVENELGGRFLEINEAHGGPFTEYLHTLFGRDLGLYAYAFPLALIMVLNNKQTRNLAIFSSIMIASHWLILSLSQTKLSWYALPQAVYFSIIFGLVVQAFFDELRARKNWLLISYFLIAGLLAVPTYLKVTDIVHTKNPIGEIQDYQVSRYIIENMEHVEYLDNAKVLIQDYAGHVLFYIEQYKSKGGRLQHTYFNTLEVGDKVLMSHENLKERLQREYKVNILKTEYGVTLYLLLEKC